MSKELLEAIRLSNTGHHYQASEIYRREGNKERPIAEKRELWAAADKARKIANSD